MASEQKIVPSLWFDGNAKEAVEFYISTFPNGKVVNTSYYPTESLADFQKPLAGKELTIDFELDGYRFTTINAGSEFKPNPSISFFYTCDSKGEIDSLWAKLSAGGKELMPLQKYPFSEYYGWVQDKYGFSWQLILNNSQGDWRPKIVPSLMFVGKNAQAEEAMKFYTSIFDDAKISDNVNYQPAGSELEGLVSFADFTLAGEWLAAMDGGPAHDFGFNEALSLVVNCEDQAEIDYFFEKLSFIPESEICGWLKDKYGVSWQITPKNWEELMLNPDGTTKPKAFAAMMKMKKLDIAKLKAAADNN